MGTSPAAGRHAAPRTGLPPRARASAGARHAKPSQVPAGAALATVVTGGVLALALPASGDTGATPTATTSGTTTSGTTTSAVTGAAVAAPVPRAAAAAAAVQGPSPSVAREALADRASRSRRAPVVVVATPLRARAVSPPAAPPVLPGCTQAAASGGANGRLAGRVLCDVGSGERLRADAARAYAALAVAYESRFDTAPCLIDGYRTLGEQEQLRRAKPRLAARPGSSEHGWGLAIDLGCGVQSRRTVQHAWMQENAPRLGWVNPEWAQTGGSRPEPWHWEFGSGA